MWKLTEALIFFCGCLSVWVTWRLLEGHCGTAAASAASTPSPSASASAQQMIDSGSEETLQQRAEPSPCSTLLTGTPCCLQDQPCPLRSFDFPGPSSLASLAPGAAQNLLLLTSSNLCGVPPDPPLTTSPLSCSKSCSSHRCPPPA